MKRSIPAGPTAVVALLVAILAGLGVWQWRRLEWKEGLIARLEARRALAAEPLPPPSQWAALAPDDYDYRRVRARGRYLPAAPVQVRRPSAPDGAALGPGYLVMRPFELTSGGTLVVDAGFVPLNVDAKDVAPPPAGEVEIVGLMRPPEGRSAFTPADEPARDSWFTRDPAAIAAFWGLRSAAPFSLDLAPDAAIRWPRGGATQMDIPNNHLSYALTWWGLAAALAVFYAVWLARGRQDAGRAGAERARAAREKAPQE